MLESSDLCIFGPHLPVEPFPGHHPCFTLPAGGKGLERSFLGPGNWKVRLWQDAADSTTNPEDLAASEKVVRASDALSLKLAPSGGMVAIFSPQQ